jgi:Amidase
MTLRALSSVWFASALLVLSVRTVVYTTAFNVVDTTIGDIEAAFADGSLNCTQLVQMHLDRIRAYDEQGPRVNSMIYVNPRLAQEASALDALPLPRRKALHCIPVIVKDNINVAGMPTSGGCVTLQHELPAGDAFVVAQLRGAGAIFMGKANMAEFAMVSGARRLQWEGSACGLEGVFRCSTRVALLGVDLRPCSPAHLCSLAHSLTRTHMSTARATRLLLAHHAFTIAYHAFTIAHHHAFTTRPGWQ